MIDCDCTRHLANGDSKYAYDFCVNNCYPCMRKVNVNGVYVIKCAELAISNRHSCQLGAGSHFDSRKDYSVSQETEIVYDHAQLLYQHNR